MSASAQQVTAADYIRVTTVAAWCVTLLWLLSSWEFKKFIAPSLWWLLLMGVICLLLFLVGMLISGSGDSHHHGEADNPWIRGLVVLMPLVFLGVAVPQGSLGGFALEKRSLDFVDGPVEFVSSDLVDPTNTPNATTRNGSSNGTRSELTLTDLLYELETADSVQVTTEGMLFHSKRLGEGQCMLFRFVMTCCAADAQPVSMILVHPEVNSLGGDTWVRVTGTATMMDVRGVQRGVLKADELEVIQEPVRPYLSPY